jgi:SAM-dependent methyltransferase
MHQRYVACLPFVAAKDVIDVGCGDGRGTALLAASARTVAGVDARSAPDWHAVFADNTTFRTSSESALPFGPACADVVLSLGDALAGDSPAKMLAEMRRVLRPSGVMIVAWPRPPFASRDRESAAPFDVLRSLRAAFASVTAYAQTVAHAAVIRALPESEGEALRMLVHPARMQAPWESEPGGDHVIAVCAASRSSEPALASVLVDAVPVETAAERDTPSEPEDRALLEWRLEKANRGIADQRHVIEAQAVLIRRLLRDAAAGDPPADRDRPAVAIGGDVS